MEHSLCTERILQPALGLFLLSETKVALEFIEGLNNKIRVI